MKLLLAALAATAISPSASAAGKPTLEEVREATSRFQDVNVALAEGYARDPTDMCDTADMTGRLRSLGGMGIHFFRPDLLGITAPPNPRVDGNGTHTDFRKQTKIDEAHLFEPHYDRHVWLYRSNSNGMFAQFNPTVTCQYHKKPKAAGHAAH